MLKEISQKYIEIFLDVSNTLYNHWFSQTFVTSYNKNNNSLQQFVIMVIIICKFQRNLSVSSTVDQIKSYDYIRDCQVR